jgi:anti-anti-sigma factor
MDAYPTSSDEHRRLITVRGEIDLATAEYLFRRLVTLVGQAPGEIALDLSQVTFIDCTGLRALSGINSYVQAAGGRVRLVALSPQVARLYELVGRDADPPCLLARTVVPFVAGAARAIPVPDSTSARAA